MSPAQACPFSSDRLCANPKGKAKTVAVTEAGKERARDWFRKMFGTSA